MEDHPYDQQWKQATGLSTAAFKLHMLSGLPQGTSLEIDYGGGKDFWFAVENPAQGKIDGFFRFKYRGEFGSHIELSSGNAAGRQGMASQIHQRLSPLLEQSKIRQIQVTANNIGSYYWLKMGAYPNPNDYVLPRLAHAFTELAHKVSPTTQRSLSRAFASRSPKAVWTIADCDERVDGVKLGFRLLRNVGWSGKCDFKDLDCQARWLAHIKAAPASPYHAPWHSLPLKYWSAEAIAILKRRKVTQQSLG